MTVVIALTTGRYGNEDRLVMMMMVIMVVMMMMVTTSILVSRCLEQHQQEH